MIPNQDFDDYNIKALVILDWCVSVISLISSLVLCYFCLRIPSPKTVSVKFILLLAMSDFFYSVSNILSYYLTNEDNDLQLCYIQGAMRNASFILTSFFSACTAIVSYKSSLPKGRFNLNLFFITAVLFGLFFFVFVPMIT